MGGFEKKQWSQTSSPWEKKVGGILSGAQTHQGKRWQGGWREKVGLGAYLPWHTEIFILKVKAGKWTFLVVQWFVPTTSSEACGPWPEIKIPHLPLGETRIEKKVQSEIDWAMFAF